MTREQIVRAQLMRLGIAPHHRGFTYLEQAVALWYPGVQLTKEVYPAIAKANRTSYAAVEKNVRQAIKKAWDEQRGKTDAIFAVFGLWAISQRPQAMEFITAVAIWAETVEGKGEDKDEV